MRNGVVADTSVATEVLHHVFSQFSDCKNHKLRVLACAPSDTSEFERRNLLSAIRQAGAETSVLIPEPIAALVGAGVDIGTGKPCMVIDIGEGVIDCAVVMGKHIHASVALRGGCSTLRGDMVTHIRQTSGVTLSVFESESLLRQVGLRAPSSVSELIPLSGGHLITPVLITTFLRERADEIVHTVLRFLETLSPEICADVISNEVEMTGGGALIPGLVEYCAQKSHLSIVRAPSPLESVIHGACSILGPTSTFDLWDNLQQFWNSH